jgi:uncharacterized protein (TIGR04255 family)
MAEPLPEFDAPPVIETALSVQFERLQGYSTAMAGWFWKSYLARLPGGEAWTKSVDAGRLEDQFQRFGAEELWVRPGFRMGPVGEPQRTQIIRDDDERMVQIQDSRLILNWRKKSAAYPSFETVYGEFRETILPTFERFVTESGLAPLEPNQWEVAYINHIPRGELWQSPQDWSRVAPGLTFPQASAGVHNDTFSADWRYVLGENLGRLFVGVRHIKPVEGDDTQILQIQLTARGAVDPGRGLTLARGLELGHESIVRTFAAMTSSEAHRHWRRRI